MELLKVENLSVEIGRQKDKVKPVRDVSFSLHKGEVLAIVGESGCGKSMLCKSVIGLLPKSGKITAGSIYVAGTDITHYTERQMEKLRGSFFSMIFQDPLTALDPTYTIGSQIAEAIRVHHKDMTKAEVNARVLELMHLVGIEEPQERKNLYPYNFSGGMRQRSVMAIALASNPKVLLADEPTTALDVTIQAQILDLLRMIQQELDTATILVSHDLGVVAEVCDQVVVMYCGRVVEKGSVYDIFGKPSHPYTEGLLNSIPKLGEHVEELESIPGNVPNPKYMPKGCKFAPRCKYAVDRCREEEPGFTDLGNGHQSRCWRCVKEGGKD